MALDLNFVSSTAPYNAGTGTAPSQNIFLALKMSWRTMHLGYITSLTLLSLPTSNMPIRSRILGSCVPFQPS